MNQLINDNTQDINGFDSDNDGYFKNGKDDKGNAILVKRKIFKCRGCPYKIVRKGKSKEQINIL